VGVEFALDQPNKLFLYFQVVLSAESKRQTKLPNVGYPRLSN
jgi:hypothetical protein